MYLAWSMTYFHINLDPRGKKKKVFPPILIPVIILEVLGVFSFRFGVGFFCFCLFFWFFRGGWFFTSERAFKDTSSGRNMGDHSAIQRPRAAAAGVPLNHLEGVGFRLLLPVQWFYRCSMLTFAPNPPHPHLLFPLFPDVWSVWVCVPGKNTHPLTLCLPAPPLLSRQNVNLSLFITVLLLSSILFVWECVCACVCKCTCVFTFYLTFLSVSVGIRRWRETLQPHISRPTLVKSF